jgi:hypothetical protein
MAKNTGIDPMRGRPTPGFASTEEKIQRRKLDSLKRGIHRIRDEEGMPYRIHLVGIGAAGTAVVANALAQLSDEILDEDGARVSVLAVDIGNTEGLDAVRREKSRILSNRAHIEILQLEVPSEAELRESLARYPEFLRLEYPLYQAEAYKPWLNEGARVPLSEAHVPRAIAKAVYGRAYYDQDRPADAALRRFAKSVAATPGESLVCICFGLGGGTGSGVAVDLARHLSNVRFGRRVLVAGIGIAPCDGDVASHTGARLYPVLSELDCMGDEAKNQGVVMACGDLYRNPFTAGFLLVPQQHVWEGSADLRTTHARIEEELASLITARNGANLWETLRLLNWVAAPTTQHSAARTPYGTRWIHMLGFADVDGKKTPIDSGLPVRLGLLPTYKAEFIEARVVSANDAKGEKAAKKLNAEFSPVIEPELTGGGRAGSIQFILPQVSKTDLALFTDARNAYDSQTYEEKLLNHSWLLERGVMLCEPSTKIDGMAGASLSEQGSWVAVPYTALRGEEGNEQKVAVETV